MISSIPFQVLPFQLLNFAEYFICQFSFCKTLLLNISSQYSNSIGPFAKSLVLYFTNGPALQTVSDEQGLS